MNDERHAALRLWTIWILLASLCVLLGLWFVFGKLIVPAIIEGAYRGESLSVLNRLIRGQARFPVDHYLRLWDATVARAAIALAGFGLLGVILFAATSGASFFRKYVGPATPGSLGALRMLTCLIVLATTALEDLPSIAMLPPETRVPHGLMRFVYALPVGFERLLASETGLGVFQLGTEVILFLGVLGWGTRIVIPLGAVGHFLLGGILRDYSFDWHQGWVPLYLMAVLSFTPCGDGWSVDRLWRLSRGRPVPDADRPLPIYGWSRYLCWVAIACPYVESGLGKLRYGGLSWFSASNMRSILYTDALIPREFDWQLPLHLVHAPDIVFTLLAVASVGGEVSFGLVLFSRAARWVLPIVMALMHLGIFGLQRILFVDLILLQSAFVDFRVLRVAMGRRLAARRGRVQVAYDASSPFWRRAIRVLAGLDLFDRLQRVPEAEPGRELRVVRHGRVHRGVTGMRIIARSLPALWAFAAILYVPGLSALGAMVRRPGASGRSEAGADRVGAAPALAGETGALGGGDRLERAAHGWRFPLVVSSWVLVAMLSWFYHVEYYPLSSWQLFGWADTSGRITYNKVVARFESGERAPLRLEDGIGAMRFDGRYNPFLAMCFGKPHRRPANPDVEDSRVCREFLTASGAAYNRKARPGRRVTQLEIQAWEWDFGAHPSDPQHGRVVDRFVIDIEAERNR
jgi:hypothetical protein